MTSDRNKPWAAVSWEKCKGMNSDKKKCAKTSGKTRHITHKHHWLGGWYGMLSHENPKDLSYGPNKPRPKGPKRKDSKGIWRW